jgi:hypothetical protein
MSIGNVFLFVSSSSANCGQCMPVVQKSGLPIQVVRLDTPELRERAMNGSHIQIRSVPTLTVVYTDNSIQNFVGAQKVIGWIRQVVEGSSQKEDASYDHESSPMPRSEGKSRSSRVDSRIESTPLEDPKPSRKSRSKKKSKRGRKKPAPVEFYDSDEEGETEIQFVDDLPANSKPSTKGLMVGPAATMNNKNRTSGIKEAAKLMEEQRRQTLGYDEKSLPVSGY